MLWGEYVHFVMNEVVFIIFKFNTILNKWTNNYMYMLYKVKKIIVIA